MSLEFTLVRRAISLAVIDGPDTGDNPDILKAQGSVLFEPVIKKGDSIQVQTRGGSETYALAPIECPINDGIISHRGQDGVKLPAGGEAANPSIIRWKATFSRMQAGGQSFTLAPVVFDAVPGGEIDLTLVAPVAGTPEGIVRGPRGTSLESIIVDGSELVFTAVDDGGSFEIVRIPLDDVVRAEADAAAASAADGVRDSVKQDADRAEAAADRADARVDTAINDGAILVREEMKSTVQANAAYMGQSLAASQMATDSAKASKASEDRAKSWAELSEASATSIGDVETRVQASESSVSDSADSAASSESAARAAADAAAQSESNASSSAAQAQSSETKAKQYADSALDRLANVRAWFRGEGPPPASIPGARVGDWWLDTSSMTLHEITGV